MDFTAAVLVAFVCVLDTFPSTDAAVMCYKCDYVAHPRDCDKVMQCLEGEVCNVMQYQQADGHFYYHSGCMPTQECSKPRIKLRIQCQRRKFRTFGKHRVCAAQTSTVGRKKRDLLICKKCCNEPYCNRELCDPQSQTNTGPRCLQCTTVEDPTHCGTVTGCNIGEKCYTSEKYVFGERRYQLGCADPTCVPRTKRAINNKRQTVCEECCTGENCNRDLCSVNKTVATTRTPTTILTTKQTMASLTTANASLTFGQTTTTGLTGCRYKGVTYHKGQSWDHGCQYQCTCMDETNGKYACKDLCLKYMNVPSECKMVTPNGECCPHPDCSGTNIHMTNFSTVNYTGYIGLNDCTYEGQHYRQNETWRDSCEWECTCQDATRGYYKCHSLCYNWDLPTACHMEPAATGKCCQTPSCPLGYKINYPAGYVVN